MKQLWSFTVSRLLLMTRRRARAISQAQDSGTTLPPEIMIMIFEYVSRRSLRLDECISHQANLASALLVCRAWYHSGVAMLYTRPIVYLFSVKVLLRTLRQRDELSSCVQTIVVTIPPWNLRRSRVSYQCVRDLSTLLQTVPSVRSLALPSLPLHHHAYPRRFQREGFLGMSLQPPHLPHLRRFVFDGLALSSSLLFHTFHLVLPLLEELSLTHVVLANSLVWPSCPSLKRLQLKSCRFVDRKIAIRPPLSALIQIDIDQSRADGDDAEISDSLYPYASTLETLRLDSELFHREIYLVDYSRLTAVRHLALFLNEFSFPSPPLPTTVALMPKLESLVLTCLGSMDTCLSPWDVLECVQSLIQSGNRKFPALHALVVQATTRAWRVGLPWEERSSDLRLLCDERDIDLTLRELRYSSAFDEHRRGLPDIRPFGRVLGMEGILAEC
ncbi:hypothetical protein JAAARDRAFT_37632 [Jaapia argillacea MUCL 33604]|uniref:F-box domain-containing protein n=1 Tax=Jaapia argillacea MUCL 33604 TaxID=933084 RepID=A0A067PJN2_9AGAM|nr:hypothetical protein JAAARDRAFT_37632 [Jaapia argillacea MUCL 33604]